jgi:hypothetical protein
MFSTWNHGKEINSNNWEMVADLANVLFCSHGTMIEISTR